MPVGYYVRKGMHENTIIKQAERSKAIALREDESYYGITKVLSPAVDSPNSTCIVLACSRSVSIYAI